MDLVPPLFRTPRVAVVVASTPNAMTTLTDLEYAFWMFHAAHPEVYARMVFLTRQLVHRGYTHLGVSMIWETMRYNTMLGASPEEGRYRLNNNHRAYYARLIMDLEPDLHDIFEVRGVRLAG